MSPISCLGVVAHGPRDLRIEEVRNTRPSDGQVVVAIEAGGICGSDLHYYRHGGFGTVRIKEPMVLGHEIAGTVHELGSGVSHLAIGTRVAVNPSLPCGACRYCREGIRNQCLDMRFLGSAMHFPHTRGGFQQRLTVDAAQAIPIADSVSIAEAAVAEPLAVCLHASRQAGPLMGKRVLVAGCGPIGILSVIVARYGGATEVVATDIGEFPLSIARQVGATRTVNVAAHPHEVEEYGADKGFFDALFEASGQQSALVAGLAALRPGGVVVQLGLRGDATLPINLIVAKEIQLRGTFRFDTEFELAVQLLIRALVNVKPLLTASLPFRSADDAFPLALDRSRSIKVQLTFGQ